MLNPNNLIALAESALAVAQDLGLSAGIVAAIDAELDLFKKQAASAGGDKAKLKAINWAGLAQLVQMILAIVASFKPAPTPAP